MPQGGIKKSSARTPATKTAHSKKQASKITKPKKTKTAGTGAGGSNKGASSAKTLRKFTSGMAAKTEALLGERAGHLELIGKGKKADKKASVKGGSKKFG